MKCRRLSVSTTFRLHPTPHRQDAHRRSECLPASIVLYGIFALQNLLCLEVTPSGRHGADGYARGEIRSAIALWNVRRNRRESRPEKLETATPFEPHPALWYAGRVGVKATPRATHLSRLAVPGASVLAQKHQRV